MGSLVDADGDTAVASSALDQFAAKLRELRINAGKPTHEALMQRVPIHRTHLSRTLNGRTLPSWPLTRKLVVALQGDIGEFRILWQAARHEQDEAARRGKDEAVAAETARQNELVEQARAAQAAREEARQARVQAAQAEQQRAVAVRTAEAQVAEAARQVECARLDAAAAIETVRNEAAPRDQDEQDERAQVPGRTGAARRRRFRVAAFAAPVVTAGAVALLVVPFLSSASKAPRTGTDPALVASCYRVTARDVRVFKSATGEDIWASWLLGTRFAVSGASPKGTRFSTLLANGQHGWVTSNPRWVTPDSCE